MSEILKCSGCGAQDWKPISVEGQVLFECAYSGNRVVSPYKAQSQNNPVVEVVASSNIPINRIDQTPAKPEAEGDGCLDILLGSLLLALLTAGGTAIIKNDIENSVYTDASGNYSLPAIECETDPQLNLFLVEQNGVDVYGYPEYKTVDYENVNPYDADPDYWRTPSPTGDGDLAVVEECQDGSNFKWFYDVPEPHTDQLIVWRR